MSSLPVLIINNTLSGDIRYNNTQEIAMFSEFKAQIERITYYNEKRYTLLKDRLMSEPSVMEKKETVGNEQSW